MHLDWLAFERSTGQVWLADFKTRANFLPDFSEETNLQHTSYQKILQRHGINCNGTATIQIKSDLPQKPRQNNNGTMSRTAIKTDWETYRAALVEARLDPADYDDMRVKLGEGKFFNVMKAFRSDIEVNNVWDHVIVPAARDIAVARHSAKDGGLDAKLVYRTFSHRVCNGCDFRHVCIGGLRGYDPVGLLMPFNYRPEREAEIAAGLL